MVVAIAVNENVQDPFYSSIVQVSYWGVASGVHLGSGVVLTASHVLFAYHPDLPLFAPVDGLRLTSAAGTVQEETLSQSFSEDDLVELGGYAQRNENFDISLVFTDGAADLPSNPLIIFDQLNDIAGDIRFYGYPAAEGVGNGETLFVSEGTISRGAAENLIFAGEDLTSSVLTSDLGAHSVPGFSGAGVFLETQIDGFGQASGLVGLHVGGIRADPSRDISYSAPLSGVYQELAESLQSAGFSADDFATNLIVSSDDGMTVGTFFNEMIVGTAGQDQLFAREGDDILYDYGGQDAFFGGEGFDTLVYSTSRHDFEIFSQDQGRWLSSAATSDFDFIDSIEKVEFTDGTLVFDETGTSSTAETYRLYQTVFDRDPDISGLSFWVDAYNAASVDLWDMAVYFMTSEEFAQTYGAPGTVSDAEFLTLLYNNVLDRDPDQAGFDFWRDQQANGLSQSEMIVHFSESDENRAKTIAEIADGIWLL